MLLGELSEKTFSCEFIPIENSTTNRWRLIYSRDIKKLLMKSFFIPHPFNQTYSRRKIRMSMFAFFLTFLRSQLAKILLLNFWMSDIHGSILVLQVLWYLRPFLGDRCILLETLTSLTNFWVDNCFSYWISPFFQRKQPRATKCILQIMRYFLFTIPNLVLYLKGSASIFLYFSFCLIRFPNNR